MGVGDLIERLPVFVGEKFEHPAIQYGWLAKVTNLIAHQFVSPIFLDHALPKSLVGISLGGIDKLRQDGCEALEPAFHAVLLQLLCFLQHLLPVFWCAREGDAGNATTHIMNNVVEVGLHRLHQRDLRGDALCNACGGEVCGDGLGNVAFGVLVDLFSEASDEFLPVRIPMYQFLVGLYH